MRRINIYLLLTGLLMCLFSCKNNPSHISLAGEWEFALDSTDTGINENWAGQNFKNTILLPGTTDDAGYGTPNKLAPAIQSRKSSTSPAKTVMSGRPGTAKKSIYLPAGKKKRSNSNWNASSGKHPYGWTANRSKACRKAWSLRTCTT